VPAQFKWQQFLFFCCFLISYPAFLKIKTNFEFLLPEGISVREEMMSNKKN
jgi:hypothetical protein